MKKKDLMKLKNVVGYGDGFKNGGKEKAIIVFVEKKLPEAELTKEDIVPKKLGKKKTDVVEIGEVKALAVDRKKKMRPARPGISIGHYKITAGTFGAVVYKRVKIPKQEWVECKDHSILSWLISIFAPDQKLMRLIETEGEETEVPLILSNNHVLANENDAQIGDDIWQPGPYDKGTVNDTIGKLLEFVPLVGIGNVVDAALAIPHDQNMVDPDIIEIGMVNGTADVSINQDVKKSGRTTGLTTGKITAKNVMISVGYGSGPKIFSKQIVTTNMSAGGDSGSLVLDNDNNAVGLLFAGSDTATIINPISEVVKALNITFK